MRKSSIPIIIMVAANLALFLTFTATGNDSGFWNVVASHLIAGQICLLAVWLSLGRRFGPCRLICFVIGIQAWCYLLTLKFEGSLLGMQCHLCILGLLVALPIWIGRWLGLTIIDMRSSSFIEPDTPMKHSSQFTLSSLFAWTTSLAICLGLVCWTISHGNYEGFDIEALFDLYLSFGFFSTIAPWIMTVYASLWLALGSRLIVARLLVFAMTLTVAVILWPNVPEQEIERLSYSCGPAALSLISFLLVRAGGYRVAFRPGSSLASDNFMPLLVVICFVVDFAILELGGITGNPLVPHGFFQGPLSTSLILSQVGFVAIWTSLGQRHGLWRCISLLIVILAWSLILDQGWLGPFGPNGNLLEDIWDPSPFNYSVHVGMVNEFGLFMTTVFLLSALAVIRLNHIRIVNINEQSDTPASSSKNFVNLKLILQAAIPLICLALYGIVLLFFWDLDKLIDMSQLRIALAAFITTLVTTWAIFDLEHRSGTRLLILAATVVVAVVIAPHDNSQWGEVVYSSTCLIISLVTLLAVMHAVTWKSGYRIASIVFPPTSSAKIASDEP